MGKINSIQFCSIFIMIVLETFFGLEGTNILKISGNSSLISIILGFIIGILILLIFFKIFNFKPNLNINEKNIILFGNKIGKIINIILLICFINISITSFYNLNNFIGIQFLNKTPFLVIGLLFSIVIFYINTKGLETISRVSFILLSISLIFIIIPSISLFKNIELNNFLPIINTDINNIYMGSLDIIIKNILPIFLLLIIPKERISDNKTNKYIIISYILIFIIIFNIFINTIGILGINLATLYQYPEYIIYKRINIFNFINRIENILILQWIFEIFITISLVTHYISKTITKKNNNYLYIIITLFPLFMSLLIFKNENDFKNYIDYIISITRIILLILYCLISFKIILYNQNNNNSQNNNN